MSRPARATPADRDTTMTETPADMAARGTGGLLVDPVFGPYFMAKLVSTAGIWVFNIVSAILVWELTRSSTAVGAVSVALFLPQILFAPASGAQADRRSPTGQLLAGRLLVALGSGGLAAVITVLGTDELPGAWVIIAAAAVVGVGFVVGGPAQHSLLPSLVRPSELSRAVALNSLPPTLGRAGGPVLGAFLLLTAGPAAAFMFTCVSNLVFGAVVVVLPLAGRVARAGKSDGTVRAGFVHLRADPVVAFLLGAMLAIGLGSDPIVTLTPSLSASFGAGEELVGAFATAFGIGSALAYLAVSRLRSRYGVTRLSNLGLTAMSTGLLVTGLAPNVAVAHAGLVLAGVGFCWGMTGITTRIYERVPETLRGRMMALWAIAFAGSRPVGAAISGAVADHWSVTVAFVFVSTVVATLAAVASAGADGRSRLGRLGP